MEFTYKPQDLEILKNFQTIKNTLVIDPDKFSIRTSGMFAFYTFDTPHDHEPYGVYDLSQYNQILNSSKNVAIEIVDTDIIVTDTEMSSNVRYRSSPVDSIEPINDPTSKFDNADKTAVFTFPSEKIGALRKMGDILKFEKIYFEATDSGDIKITGADANKVGAENVFEETIGSSNVESNDLDQTLVIDREIFNMILPGHDYKVEISFGKRSCLTRWSNTIITGLKYFTPLAPYEY